MIESPGGSWEDTRDENWRPHLAIKAYHAMTVSMKLPLCGLMVGLCVVTARSEEPTKDSLDRDYSAELPRLAPKEPGEALATFHVAPGFKLEQVAAEPLVTDPVAICFDENLRMFVCEMRGYSENNDEKVSRITCL